MEQSNFHRQAWDSLQTPLLQIKIGLAECESEANRNSYFREGCGFPEPEIPLAPPPLPDEYLNQRSRGGLSNTGGGTGFVTNDNSRQGTDNQQLINTDMNE